jgi:site-specific DNA recombinase
MRQKSSSTPPDAKAYQAHSVADGTEGAAASAVTNSVKDVAQRLDDLFGPDRRMPASAATVAGETEQWEPEDFDDARLVEMAQIPRGHRRALAAVRRKSAGKRMRAILYSRYSTPHQNPTSLARQFLACRRYAAMLDMEVVAEISDPEMSGMLLNRPGHQRMMLMIEKDEADVVIVETGDRSDRSLIGFVLTWHLVTGAGKELHDVARGKVDDPLIAAVIGGMAESERRKMRVNMDAGRLAAHEAGLNMGMPPFGYERTMTPGMLEEHPVRAPIVRKIFRLAGDGLFPSEISRELNDKGLKRRNGKAWKAETVTALLRNTKYYGVQYINVTIKAGKTTLRRDPSEVAPPVPTLYPRLVSYAQYRKAQAMLARVGAQRAARRAPAPRAGRLLSGLLYCSFCGEKMFIGGGPRQKLTSISCSYRQQTCTAMNNAFSYEYVEQAVVDALLEKIGSRVSADRYAELLEQEQQRSDLEREANLAAVDVELVSNEREFKTVLDQQSKLARPSSLFDQRIEELNERQGELEAVKAALLAEEIGSRDVDAKALRSFHDAIDLIRADVPLTGHTVEATRLRNAMRPLIAAVKVTPAAGMSAYVVETKFDFSKCSFVDASDKEPVQKLVFGGGSYYFREAVAEDVAERFKAGEWAIGDELWARVRSELSGISREGYPSCEDGPRWSDDVRRHLTEIMLVSVGSELTIRRLCALTETPHWMIIRFRSVYFEKIKELIARWGNDAFGLRDPDRTIEDNLVKPLVMDVDKAVARFGDDILHCRPGMPQQRRYPKKLTQAILDRQAVRPSQRVYASKRSKAG